jgi:RNA polymerase sigma factor (TIGR02999 family)
MGEITLLLQAARQGDAAASGQLYTLLYDDLVRLARSRLRGGRVTLADTGALVHESWMRLQRAHQIAFEARGQFLAYAARAMQSVLVDTARQRQAQQRGGDVEHVPLDTAAGERIAADDNPSVLAVHEALEQLARLDPPLADLVRLRYFVGLDEGEVAELLGLTERQVRRQWDKARAFLAVALKD